MPYEQVYVAEREELKLTRDAVRQCVISEEIETLATKQMRTGLTDLEFEKMSALIDETQKIKDDYTEGRATDPDRPGRRAGESLEAGSIGEPVTTTSVSDDVTSERRGWRVTTPAAGKDRGGFHSFSEFLGSIKTSREGNWDKRLDAFSCERRAMGTSPGADGGFIVPSFFMAGVDKRASQTEPWLERRTQFTLSPNLGNSVEIPTLQDNDRSNDDIGGLKMFRSGENSTLTEDAFVLANKNLKLHKAASIVIVSNELMSDSAVGVDTILQQLFGDIVALQRARDGLTGTGAGEPLGIANAVDLVTVATSTGAGNLLVADVAGMVAKLTGGGNESTAWVLHPSVFLPLASLRFSTTAGEPAMYQPNLAGAAPGTLYGFPVFFSDSCETSDTVGDIYLANLNEYFYLSTEPTIDLSRDEKFSSDQVVFRLRMRDDGQPKRSGPLVDRKSYTSANFVRLATRS